LFAQKHVISLLLTLKSVCCWFRASIWHAEFVWPTTALSLEMVNVTYRL